MGHEGTDFSLLSQYGVAQNSFRVEDLIHGIKPLVFQGWIGRLHRVSGELIAFIQAPANFFADVGPVVRPTQEPQAFVGLQNLVALVLCQGLRFGKFFNP